MSVNLGALYYSQFRKAMHMTEQQAALLFQDAAIPLTEEIRLDRRSLTREELERLRNVLPRFLSGLPAAGEESGESYASHPDARAKSPPAPKEEKSVSAAPQRQDRPQVFLPCDPRMERLVRENMIMIDTCSLMEKACANVIDMLLPAFVNCGRKIIVPERVFKELKKHAADQRDRKRMASAQSGLELCRKLLKADCLSIRGGDKDNFADNVFFVSFSSYRLRYRMLLITQDRDLTHDILQLNAIGSNGGYPVRVMHITADGQLQESFLN